VFVFLRQYRHTLWADPLQQARLTRSQDQPQGHPPVPPAHLALATLLQAYPQVSDDEVIEATTRDRRWQWVLDWHDAETPPFRPGPWGAFRPHLLAPRLERRVVERTVERAATRGTCGPRQWRAALESRPLWDAGRVDNTSKLVGHARQQGRGRRAVAAAAGASLRATSRRKAAWALDWDDPQAPPQALPTLLDALQTVEQWLDTQPCA
jgi:transposase